MYTRKTKDIFLIEKKTGFDGKYTPLSFKFEDEKKCDKKLSELNKMVEDSRNDPVLHPFSFMDSYRKVKKRMKL